MRRITPPPSNKKVLLKFEVHDEKLKAGEFLSYGVKRCSLKEEIFLFLFTHLITKTKDISQVLPHFAYTSYRTVVSMCSTIYK